MEIPTTERFSMNRTLVCVALTGALSCGSGVTGLPEDVEYAPELGVDLTQMTRLSGGVYIQDLTVGTGDEVEVGDFMEVGYTGWLVDGTVFDSRASICFALIRGALIEGWIVGIPGMREGGKRKIVIPPSFGYGGRGAPPDIPGDATLVFDIELIDIPAQC